MHDIYTATPETRLAQALRDEVANVHPGYVLPTILAGARRREAWLIVLVATLGALFIVVGLLLLTWGQEQPAPAPSPSSTRLWEA